ncbi:MAG: hypothetical protein ACFB10_25720 [Salibacteraceae bacterium]|mgnify:CR=1 FL=1
MDNYEVLAWVTVVIGIMHLLHIGIGGEGLQSIFYKMRKYQRLYQLKKLQERHYLKFSKALGSRLKKRLRLSSAICLLLGITNVLVMVYLTPSLEVGLFFLPLVPCVITYVVFAFLVWKRGERTLMTADKGGPGLPII